MYSHNTILAPIYYIFYKSNEELLKEIHEEMKIYKSIDNLAHRENNINNSPDFLNLLKTYGFHPHYIK